MKGKQRYVSLLVVGLVVSGVLAGVLIPFSELAEGELADSPWPMFRGGLNHSGQSPYDASYVDGTEKWNFTTGDDVYSSPAIGSNGTIYVGSDDNHLYAVNPNGTEKWNFTTGGSVSSSPVIGSNGTIYVGSSDNNLYAINADGTEKWNFSTGHYVMSSPAIGSNGTVYVGSWDDNVYAVNPNGTEKWRFPTGSYVDSSPAISSDGTIYIGSDDNHLYAVIPEDGSEKWNVPTGSYVHSSPAISSDGTIYVGSDDNNLYAINPNGTENWRFSTGDSVRSSPAIDSDGTIYVGSYDNKLHAIAGVPLAPQNLKVIAGDGQVNLSWDRGSSITEYKIYRGTSSGNLSYHDTVSGSTYLYNDTGLTNGQTYYYQLCAVNDVGEGELTAEVSATPVGRPSAPQYLQATAGDSKVDLSWEAPADDGGSSITEYRIYRGTVSGDMTYHDSLSGSTYSYTDTGRTNGQTYYYQVSAVNDVGEGALTEEVNATPVAVPSAPQNLNATAGDTQLDLSWDAPADDGGSSITEYRIYRGTVSNVITYHDNLSGSTYSYRDTGRTNGQTYYYQVSAVNKVGEGSKSAVKDATPFGPPLAPQNLDATTGNGEVVLEWSSPDFDGGSSITEYKIYRGTTSDGLEALITVDNIHSYTDTDVTNGQTYYYRVSAVNRAGESEMSKEVSAYPFNWGLLMIIIGVIAVAAVVSWHVIRCRKELNAKKEKAYRALQSLEYDIIKMREKGIPCEEEEQELERLKERLRG